jgi:hypothetical protein
MKIYKIKRFPKEYETEFFGITKVQWRILQEREHFGEIGSINKALYLSPSGFWIPFGYYSETTNETIINKIINLFIERVIK